MGLYYSIPSVSANAQAWLSNSLHSSLNCSWEQKHIRLESLAKLSWSPISSWPRLTKPMPHDPARAPMCLSWNLTLWYPLILSPLSVVRVITIVVHQYNQIQEFKCLLFVHPIYLSHLPRRNVCNPKLRLTILAKCNIWILDVGKVTFWQQVAILYIWTLASDSSSICFFMLQPQFNSIADWVIFVFFNSVILYLTWMLRKWWWLTSRWSTSLPHNCFRRTLDTVWSSWIL